jgi:hypothetical protein
MIGEIGPSIRGTSGHVGISLQGFLAYYTTGPLGRQASSFHVKDINSRNPISIGDGITSFLGQT